MPWPRMSFLSHTIWSERRSHFQTEPWDGNSLTLSAHDGPCPVITSSALSAILSAFLVSLFQSIVMYPSFEAIWRRMIVPPTARATAFPTFTVMKPVALKTNKTSHMTLAGSRCFLTSQRQRLWEFASLPISSRHRRGCDPRSSSLRYRRCSSLC